MDPLSIQASLVGLLTAIYSNIKILRNSDVLDVPDLASRLLAALGDIAPVLENMKSIIDNLQSLPAHRKEMIHIQQLAVIFRECVISISEVDVYVARITDSKISSPRMVFQEPRILRVLERLESQKASLYLMMNILQCESDSRAREDFSTLGLAVDNLIEQNDRVYARLRDLDLELENPDGKFRETLGLTSSDGTSLDGPELTGGRHLSDFEATLLRSRVYRSTMSGESDASFRSSQARSSAWSKLDDLSLNDVSIFATMGLPLSLDKINALGPSLTLANMLPNSEAEATSAQDAGDSPLEAVEIPIIEQLDQERGHIETREQFGQAGSSRVLSKSGGSLVDETQAGGNIDHAATQADGQVPAADELPSTGAEPPPNPFSDSGYGTATVATSRDSSKAGTGEDPIPRAGASGLNIESESGGRELYDDLATVYSDSSSLPSLDQGYLSDMTDNFLGKIFGMDLKRPSAEGIERLFEILPDVLKAFSLKLGFQANTQKHRDIMYFVHRHRNAIARDFQAKYSYEEAWPEPAPSVDRSDVMPRNELVHNWFSGLDSEIGAYNGESVNSYTTSVEYEPKLSVPWTEDLEDASILDEISDSSSHEDPDENLNLAEIDPYGRIIAAEPAYEWLISRLRRELSLTTLDGHSSMHDIRRTILSSLATTSQKISRKRCADSYKVVFVMHWDIAEFLEDQEYGAFLKVEDAVELAITLTGSDKDAQALTTAEYVCQTWPFAGEQIIRLLKEVVKGPRHGRHECALPDRTELVVWRKGPELEFEVIGTAESVAEIGELVAWLGSALRSSPPGVSYCTPSAKQVGGDIMLEVLGGTKPWPDATFRITFLVERGPNSLQVDCPNGSCWQNIFRNPLIVRGYPIPRRAEYNTGLEMPLHIISALVRARRVNVFDGKLFIKSFSAMLVAVRRCADLLIWHYVFNKDGEHLPYQDHGNLKTESISRYDMREVRHIVGWCSEVNFFAGAPGNHYDIHRSYLPGPHAGCALEKVIISGGQFFTPGIEVAVGVRESPVHVPPDGYIPRLNWVSNKFVVLWDEADKRGWLVDGASALMHLLRASLKIDKEGKFRKHFCLAHDKMIESTTPFTADAAIDFLTDESNMELEIFPAKLGSSGVAGAAKRNQAPAFLIKDRVERLWDCLEQMICHQVSVAGQSGVNLKVRPRRYLEGWDFTTLAAGDSPFYPKVATLQTFGKGWVDFIRSIHAIVLCGRGFGELVRPVNRSSLCSAWVAVPTGKYYLTVCTSTLKEIIELKGNKLEHPIRLSDSIVWHVLEERAQECQCKGKSTENGKHSDVVQVLWPCGQKNKLPRRAPMPLSNSGAVIFGHNSRFKWHWNDEGNPVQGEPMPPSQDHTDDSGLGSSVGQLATNSSVVGAILDSQPSLHAEASPNTLLKDGSSAQAVQGSAIASTGRAPSTAGTPSTGPVATEKQHFRPSKGFSEKTRQRLRKLGTNFKKSSNKSIR